MAATTQTPTVTLAPAAVEKEALSQTTIVTIAAVVPTSLLCIVLVCIMWRKVGGPGVRSKHGGAQVLSTHGMTSVAGDKEFQSSREMHNIYGPAPLPKGVEYEMVCDGDLLPPAVLRTGIYTPAPAFQPIADVDTDDSGAEANIYDRVDALPVYDAPGSKLNR